MCGGDGANHWLPCQRGCSVSCPLPQACGQAQGGCAGRARQPTCDGGAVGGRALKPQHHVELVGGDDLAGLAGVVGGRAAGMARAAHTSHRPTRQPAWARAPPSGLPQQLEQPLGATHSARKPPPPPHLVFAVVHHRLALRPLQAGAPHAQPAAGRQVGGAQQLCGGWECGKGAGVPNAATWVLGAPLQLDRRQRPRNCAAATWASLRQHHSRPRSPAGSTPQQAALRRRRAHPPAARGTTAARPSRPSASCSRCALPPPGPTPATCESNGAHKARVGMLGKRRAWPPPARCLPAAAAAAPGVALSPLGLRAQRRGGRFLRVCRSASRGGGARPASLEAAVLTMLPRCARWLRLMTE